MSTRPMHSKREEGRDDVGDDWTMPLVVACFMRSCRWFEEDASRMDVSIPPWLADRSVSCLPFRMPQRKVVCFRKDRLCGLWWVRRFGSVGGISGHSSWCFGATFEFLVGGVFVFLSSAAHVLSSPFPSDAFLRCCSPLVLPPHPSNLLEASGRGGVLLDRALVGGERPRVLSVLPPNHPPLRCFSPSL